MGLFGARSAYAAANDAQALKNGANSFEAASEDRVGVGTSSQQAREMSQPT